MSGRELHLTPVASQESPADTIARLTRQVVVEMAHHADVGLQAAHVWLEGLGNGYGLQVQHP